MNKDDILKMIDEMKVLWESKIVRVLVGIIIILFLITVSQCSMASDKHKHIVINNYHSYAIDDTVLAVAFNQQYDWGTTETQIAPGLAFMKRRAYTIGAGKRISENGPIVHGAIGYMRAYDFRKNKNVHVSAFNIGATWRIK